MTIPDDIHHYLTLLDLKNQAFPTQIRAKLQTPAERHNHSQMSEVVTRYNGVPSSPFNTVGYTVHDIQNKDLGVKKLLNYVELCKSM